MHPAAYLFAMLILLAGACRIGRLARIRRDWLRCALLGPVVPVHALLTLLNALVHSPALLLNAGFYSEGACIYEAMFAGALAGRE
jgi:hypothetical protein